MDSALLSVMNAVIAGALHLECLNRRTPDHLGSAARRCLSIAIAQLQSYVVGRESQFGARSSGAQNAPVELLPLLIYVVRFSRACLHG